MKAYEDSMKNLATRTCSFTVMAVVAIVGSATVGATTATADEPCEPAWHPFTSGGEVGLVGGVEALTVWNGDLVVGGYIIKAGGQTVNHIARWDGSTWHPFASGGQVGVGGDFTSYVRALAVWNGDLIVGGEFTTAGGQTVNRIARWNGSAWHPFTAGGQIGVSSPGVCVLTVWNGDLIAGGTFATAGGQTVNRIARWDGTAWHPFTSGGQTGVNSTPEALSVWNGDLVAGGSFTTAGGQTVNRIARWDGSTWHSFNSGPQIGMNDWVHTLLVWNGDLVAGGSFTTAGGHTVNRIARWEKSIWQPFTSGGQIGVGGAGFIPMNALTAWSDDLIASGHFTTAGGQTVNCVARWDGSAWHPFTSGGQVGVGGDFTPYVLALAVWNGNLIAGGYYDTAGGQAMNGIARWDACLDPRCAPADLNCDGVVNVSDLLLLLAQWGPCADCDDCPADLNEDCNVNVSDLLELLANWG